MNTRTKKDSFQAVFFLCKKTKYNHAATQTAQLCQYFPCNPLPCSKIFSHFPLNYVEEKRAIA